MNGKVKVIVTEKLDDADIETLKRLLKLTKLPSYLLVDGIGEDE